MIGLDTISLSAYSNRELGRLAHHAFLSKFNYKGDNLDPILIVEDMDMSDLFQSPKKIIVSPILFKNADGAPVTIYSYD